jgi:hypothetical protein
LKERRDYSGEFVPDIGCGDFSKDTLVELLKLCSWIMRAIDGFWYLAIKERRGNEDAFACDLWAGERVIGSVLERLTKLLGIEGKDIPAMMKFLQMDPWLWSHKYKLEVRDTNLGMLTVAHCPTLVALEREGEGREKLICGMACGGLFWRKIADFFNPDIEVNPLKLPPRQGEEKPCCQWEFKLEKQGG